MAASTSRSTSNVAKPPPFRTDKSPDAPCVLKEHWKFSHTNAICSKQQRRAARTNPSTTTFLRPNELSIEEKAKRYNAMISAGESSYNTQAAEKAGDTTTSSTDVSTDPSCQFATSYNVTIGTQYNERTGQKPTLADTACDRHMFGYASLLEDVQRVTPVTIKVANEDKESCIVASHMGTALLKGTGCNGEQCVIKIKNVLYTSSLPANLISITALYDDGYRVVDPHFGTQSNDLNLYFSNNDHILPAHKDTTEGASGNFIIPINRVRFHLNQLTMRMLTCGIFASVI